MQFDDLALVSATLATTTGRNDKVALLVPVLRGLAPREVASAVAYLVGTTPHGRIGVGWSTLAAATVAPADVATLTIGEVTAVVDRVAATAGAGSVAERRDDLAALFGRATEREQRLLAGVLGGELRQGALDGVMTAAVAEAAGVSQAEVRRATMLSGDLRVAAAAALIGGSPALRAIDLVPLRPVQPMLASPSGDVADALAPADGPVLVEAKLDGARLQAHRRGDDVRLFTRNLNDVTDRLPGVVDLVAGLPGGDLVLDGEAIGLADDGVPRRFQDTMGDFGAVGAAGVEQAGAMRGASLQAFFFDLVHLEGRSVLDEPLSVRRDLLVATVPEHARLPSVITADVAVAEGFMRRTVAAGHEGVLVKDLDQPYAAGRRGAAWRKVKPVYTFDLVVLAVEWGHGRRTGWLSNVHLGARGEAGDFVMVGKTFKGMTDTILRWQTERFLELEIGREGHVVHVRPEQVVEVAVDGVQSSTRYPGGVALRFARIRRYRDDKTAAAADTIGAVRALL